MIDLKAGMRVSCKIDGDLILDAKLQEYKGSFYICQNIQAGTECMDKLGYKYSWKIDSGSDSDLSTKNVYEFRIVGNDMEYVQKGDVITNGFYTKVVLGRVGDVVFVSNPVIHKQYDGTLSIYSLKNADYTIDIPEDDMIDIVVDGVTKRISKTSAKALNLID